MAIVKFGKVTTVGSSGLTAGKIYFETSTGLIKVAKSATEVEVFGSQVKDATYSGNILTITKTDNSNITLNFSDIASASGVMAVFEEIKDELTRVETKITTEVNAAKSTLIGSSSDTSSMDTINAAKKYADEKVAAIPAAIVYQADGTTITQSGDGPVTFSVGTIATAKVNGLDAALANKVDKEDGKGLSTNDFNAAAKGKLDGIEAGAQVNKIESIKVNGSPLSISAKAVEIPNAAADTYGVITENRVKALAGEVAGSVYKVKGTKATIDEVLEVGTAAVGDVYNVTAEFTLNSQKFPAGTNVVFVGPAEEGEPDPTQEAQWDALGGTVDLTPYETTAHASATYETKVTVTALAGRVSTVEGQVATKAEQSAVDTLSDEVDANTAAIGVLNGAGEGSVSKKVSDAIAAEVERADAAYDTKGSAASVKTTVDNYTVNGLKVSTNPTLSGDNVALSSNYSVADSYTAPAIGDKVDVAIGKLAKGIADASAAGVQSFGGQTGAITVDTTNSTNGAVKFAMSGKNLTGTVNGLKSAAYTDSSAYATAAQGAKADSALQKASITSGSANGTIAVGGSDVAVKGLGSAAYTESTAYDTKGSASTAETNAKQYADSLMTWEEFE